MRRRSLLDELTFVHNVWLALLAAIYVAFIAVYFVVVFPTLASGASDQLTRGVVIRALAEKGYVSGNIINFDRPYLLERVTTTALGDGEFIIRFKARAVP